MIRLMENTQGALNGAALGCALVAGLAINAGDTAIALGLVALTIVPVLFAARARA